MTFMFQSRCGEKTEKMQTLHREIGSNLIKIKKKHPEAQSLVYSLLDQVGKYYAYSMEVLSKKKEYKKLLQAELAMTESLTKEKDEARKKMGKMKNAILSVHKKMETDSARADQLEEEKAELEREREEFLREKEEFEMEREGLMAQRDALLQERDEMLRDRQEMQPPAQPRAQPVAQPQVQPMARPSAVPAMSRRQRYAPQRAHADVYAKAEKNQQPDIVETTPTKVVPAMA